VPTVSDCDRVVLLQQAAPQESMLICAHPASAALLIRDNLGEGTPGSALHGIIAKRVPSLPQLVVLCRALLLPPG
jgi:hypothetical protein